MFIFALLAIVAVGYFIVKKVHAAAAIFFVAALIVAGAIKVNPVLLVKRTAVPMVAAMVLNVVFSFLFIHA